MNIDHDRLCECADAAIVNVSEYTKRTGCGVRPNELPSMAGYTRDEVREATRFLIRLGMAEEVNA